jgi:hypothetical protein
VPAVAVVPLFEEPELLELPEELDPLEPLEEELDPLEEPEEPVVPELPDEPDPDEPAPDVPVPVEPVDPAVVVLEPAARVLAPPAWVPACQPARRMPADATAAASVPRAFTSRTFRDGFVLRGLRPAGLQR